MCCSLSNICISDLVEIKIKMTLVPIFYFNKSQNRKQVLLLATHFVIHLHS